MCPWSLTEVPWFFANKHQLIGLKRRPGGEDCGSDVSRKLCWIFRAPSFSEVKQFKQIFPVFISQGLTLTESRLPGEAAPSPERPDGLHRVVLVEMRFSWPAASSLDFGGVSMTKSSVSSRAAWAQLPAPVGGKAEMRFNLQALTFNPLDCPLSMGKKIYWQADVLYINTQGI